MQRALRLLVLLALLVLPVRAPAAAPPIDWAGTSWSGEAILSAKISRVGSLKGPADMFLDFGPQANPSLAANQFLIVLDDGTAALTLSGTWSLDSKGRPILLLDASSVEEDLLQLLVDVCYADLGDSRCDVLYELVVVIEPDDFKIKLKPKAVEGGVVVAGNGKLKVEFFFNGERLLRMTLGFKANALLGD